MFGKAFVFFKDILAVFGVAAVVRWVLSRLRKSDAGADSDEIRAKLDRAASEIRAAGAEIDRAGQQAGAIDSRLEAGEGRLGQAQREIKSLVDEEQRDRDIIADSQRIIDSIRGRGEADKR